LPPPRPCRCKGLRPDATSIGSPAAPENSWSGPTGGPRLPMFHSNETIRYADGKRCDMKLLSWNIQWGRGMDGRVDLARIVRTLRQTKKNNNNKQQEVAT